MENIVRKSPRIILSFFDQFPRWNGVQFEFRGTDGYANATQLSQALGKRFRDWTRTKFAKEMLEELSLLYQLPIAYDEHQILEKGGAQICAGSVKPLIDYIPGDQEMYVHRSVAIGFCMSNPRLMARVIVWLDNMNALGTATPNINDWNAMEYLRGVQFSRDDIEDMYG